MAYTFTNVTEFLQQYWTVIDLVIIGYVIYQLQKVKRRAVNIESENITTATYGAQAQAEAARVVNEAKSIALEAKQTAERASRQIQDTARRVARELKKENNR
jgi:hypothetical protein